MWSLATVLFLLIPLFHLTTPSNSPLTAFNNNPTQSEDHSSIVTGEYSLTNSPAPQPNDTTTGLDPFPESTTPEPDKRTHFDALSPIPQSNDTTATLDPFPESATPEPENSTQFEDASLNGSEAIDASPSTTDPPPIETSSPSPSLSTVPSPPDADDRLQHAPLPLESSAEATSLAPSTEDANLSIDELEKQWEEADNRTKLLNTSIELKMVKLSAKEKEAIEPNRVYEEKKKEWERLDKIATDATKDFNEKTDAAEKATGELTRANTTLTTAKEKLATAEKELKELPEMIKLAEEHLERMNNVPQNLSDTKKARDAKNSGKDGLINRVAKLAGDVANSAKGPLKTAEDDATLAWTEYNKAQCLLPANNVTQECIDNLELVKKGEAALTKAKADHQVIVDAWKVPNEELENFDTVLKELNSQIVDLEEKEGSWESFKTIAQNRVNSVKGKEPTLKQNVNTANETLRLANADFDIKNEASIKADEALVGLPDGKDAKDEAGKAKHAMARAELKCNPINGEVDKLKTELADFRKSYGEAKLTAESLKNRLDTAKRRRDEESRKGLGTAEIGGITFAVFAVIAAVVILVLCYLRKWCCFGKRKDGKCADAKLKDAKTTSNNRKSGSVKTSDGSTTPLVSNPNTASSKAGTADTTPAPGEGAPAQTPTPTKAPHFTDPFPDWSKEGPYDPNNPREKPVKIPGEAFEIHLNQERNKPPKVKLTRKFFEHEFEGTNKGVERLDELRIAPKHHAYIYDTNAPKPTYDPDSDPPGSETEKHGLLRNVEKWDKDHDREMRAGRGKRCLRQACATCTRLNKEDAAAPQPPAVVTTQPQPQNLMPPNAKAESPQTPVRAVQSPGPKQSTPQGGQSPVKRAESSGKKASGSHEKPRESKQGKEDKKPRK